MLMGDNVLPSVLKILLKTHGHDIKWIINKTKQDLPKFNFRDQNKSNL